MTEILRTWALHPSEDGQWHRMFQKLPPTVQPSEQWGRGSFFRDQQCRQWQWVSVSAPRVLEVGAVMVLLLQPVGAPQPSSGRCWEREELPWRSTEPWVGLGTFSAPPPGDRARSESKARLVPITPSLFLSVSCRLFFFGCSQSEQRLNPR